MKSPSEPSTIGALYAHVVTYVPFSVTALFVSPTGHVDMPSGVDATPGGTEPGAPLAAQEAASPEAGHGCVPSGRLSSRPFEVVEQTRAFWAVRLQVAWPVPVAVEGAGEAANAPAVS